MSEDLKGMKEQALQASGKAVQARRRASTNLACVQKKKGTGVAGVKRLVKKDNVPVMGMKGRL